jgi:hypothetical protein
LEFQVVRRLPCTGIQIEPAVFNKPEIGLMKGGQGCIKLD